MKISTLIIVLVSFIVNVSAQSFFDTMTVRQQILDFNDLASLSKLPLEKKREYLTDLGYVFSGSGVMKTKQSTDNTCEVWYSLDSFDLVRINNTSVEYTWNYPSYMFLGKKDKIYSPELYNKRKNWYTNVATLMYHGSKKYVKFKPQRKLYTKTKSGDYFLEFYYLPKEDLYIKCWEWERIIFVGDVSK